MNVSNLVSRYNAGERDFGRANLRRAKLRGVDLTSANLRAADLGEANLSKVRVTREQLDQAASLRGATLPEDTMDGCAGRTWPEGCHYLPALGPGFPSPRLCASPVAVV